MQISPYDVFNSLTMSVGRGTTQTGGEAVGVGGTGNFCDGEADDIRLGII